MTMQLEGRQVANGNEIVSRSAFVVDATRNLGDLLGEMAPAEALARAMVSERTEDREMARRWVEVYLALISNTPATPS